MRSTDWLRSQNYSIVLAIVSASLSLQTASAGNLSNELPVQITLQRNSLWCWAAASTSLLNRYNVYPGETIETESYWTGDCLVASKMYLDSGDPPDAAWFCCDYPDECNVGATFRDIERVLENNYDLDMIITEASISQTSLVNIVKTQKKPVMAILDLKNSVWDHAVLLVGVNDSGSQVEYMDPGDGSYKLASYSWFENNSTHQWIATMYPNGSPPDDVYLRYSWAAEWDSSTSPVKVGWNYIATGNIEAGPNYTVESNMDTELRSGVGKKVRINKSFWADPDSFLSISHGTN